MKTKINFFFVLMILILKHNVQGQGYYGGPDQQPIPASLSYSGGACTGSSITIFLMPGSDCYSPVVQPSGWHFSRTPSSISYETTNNGSSYSRVVATWNTPGNVNIYANYSCAGSGSSGSSNRIDVLIVAAVEPSVTMSTDVQSVCQGDRIQLRASPVNGVGAYNQQPAYSWYLDGASAPVHVGQENPYNGLDTRNIGPGLRTITVTMTSAAACLTHNPSSPSPGITFQVNAPASLTATFNANPSYCANATSFPVTINAHGDGPLTYQWYRNNILIATTSQAYYAYDYLADGDQLYGIVSSAAACPPPPLSTNVVTAHLTSAVTPEVSIELNKINYCVDETMEYSASVAGASAIGASYRWTLNGSQISTSGSGTIPVGRPDATGLYFNTDDVLAVEVSGITGTCLNSTTANNSTSAIPITIDELPTVTISSTGTVRIKDCATCSEYIKVTDFNPAYHYTWLKDGQAVAAPRIPYEYYAEENGVYSVTASSGKCKATSASLTVLINKAPKVNAGPDVTVTLPIESLTLTGTVSDDDGDPLTVKWTEAQGNVFPNMDQLSLVLTGLHKGTYTFTLTADDGLETASDQVTVTVREPPNNYNYVRQNIIQVKGADENVVERLPIGQRLENYTYFDGIGRQIQTVVTQGSPQLKDMVQPIDYDALGREATHYLPYTSKENTGYYKKSLGAQGAFYKASNDNVANDDAPYAVTVFEVSPLGRVLEQGAPGALWQPHRENFEATQYYSIKYAYETNVAGEVVKWQYTAPAAIDALGQLTTGDGIKPDYYAASQLYKTRVKNEDQYESVEYKDMEGKLILKRKQVTATTWADTYYVYDDLNNLVIVITPEATKRILQTTSEYLGKATKTKETFLNQWTFRYSYDEQHRQIVKQVPGAAATYYVYDGRDRLVLTQDGQLRAKKQWLFTKYDTRNRPMATGLWDEPLQLSQQKVVGELTKFYKDATHTYGETPSTASDNVHRYTHNSFPDVTADKFLTITYYDDYAFTSQNTVAAFLAFDPHQLDPTPTDNGQETTAFDRLDGIITGTKVKDLEATTTWYYTAMYYDHRHRLIQIQSQNQKGGVDVTTHVYDFAGKVMRTSNKHNAPGIINTTGDIVVTQKFNYDPAGRLLTTFHQVGSGPVVILSQLKYNALGQLIEKKLHSTDNGVTFKEPISYTYNIRGWLVGINTDPDVYTTPVDRLFTQRLFFNEDGNISGQTWTRQSDSGESYFYAYDTLSRLKTSRYHNYKAKYKFGFMEAAFDEFIAGEYDKGYDLNGNILRIVRNGKNSNNTYGLVDDLKYQYTGNQLTRVDDAVPDDAKAMGFKESKEANNEYSYDTNGNMAADANKDILSITYNYLNLPRQVAKLNGEYLIYSYDATGRKLGQDQYNASGVLKKRSEYLGELFVENNVLQFINHEEGRVVMNTSTPEYQYFLKDHLGNIRTTLTTKQETESVTATLENATRKKELGQFLYLNEAVLIKSDLFNHTPNSATKVSTRLSGHDGTNGTKAERVGLERSISVMPGDVINMEVYAKYLSADKTKWSAVMVNLMSLIASGSTKAIVDGGAPGSHGTTPFPWPGHDDNKGSDDGTNDPPMAFMNWLVFDRDYNVLTHGAKRITTDGAEDGSGKTFSKIQAQVTISEPGYMLVYLTNDSEPGKERDVFFDDFTVEQVKSAVIDQTDYYGFGMVAQSHRREGSFKQDYLFNGKEIQDELDLGWLDYGARMYMPDIGRWGVMDPLMENFMSVSPYNYALNGPTIFNDIEGLLPGDPKYTGSGNVVIIISDGPGYPTFDTSPLDATLWDYGIFSNLSDAQDWIRKTYGHDNIGINNLVIRTHGASGTHETQSAILDGPQQNHTYSDSEDFDYGSEQGGEAVAAIINIASYLKKNASVLLTACGASQQGTLLANSIFKAISGKKKNLTMYTNGSLSQIIWARSRKIKVGSHWNSTLNQWKPWTMTTANGSRPIKHVPGISAAGRFIFFPSDAGSSSGSSSSDRGRKKRKSNSRAKSSD